MTSVGVQLKGMYWQACLVVLIIAVFNPTTIGHFVWESIPSLRGFMEALIKGSGSFLLDGYASQGSQIVPRVAKVTLCSLVTGSG